MDERLRFMTDLIAPLRVPPGSEVKLNRDHDPGYTGQVIRAQAAALLAEGVKLLADYQDRLAAQDTFGVLLVLQGIDAAGKDGTIKHVMSGLNPQAVEVRSFKQPSAEELDHDFLWRHQRALPGRGWIGIFNRSHYEEVLVVRVHPALLAAERMPAVSGSEVWTRRYREINDWEHYLVDNGIHVVKVMLNLSKREQAKRFLKRIDHPEKNWKFSPADVRERGYWDDYQRAFEEMLSHTSTEWAPWYVVPADHKWFTRLATAAILVTALDAINPRYPDPDPAVRDEMAQVRGSSRPRRDPMASRAHGDPSHVPLAGLVPHYVDAVVTGDEGGGIGAALGQLPPRFREPWLVLGEHRLQRLLRGLVTARASAAVIRDCARLGGLGASAHVGDSQAGDDCRGDPYAHVSMLRRPGGIGVSGRLRNRHVPATPVPRGGPFALAVVGELGPRAADGEQEQADRVHHARGDPRAAVGRRADRPGPRSTPGFEERVLAERHVAHGERPRQQTAGDQRRQEADAGDADDIPREDEDALVEVLPRHSYP